MSWITKTSVFDYVEVFILKLLIIEPFSVYAVGAVCVGRFGINVFA